MNRHYDYVFITSTPLAVIASMFIFCIFCLLFTLTVKICWDSMLEIRHHCRTHHTTVWQSIKSQLLAIFT
jgi:hypothetical protein